ncbi:MAG TPA: hypothetical protein PKA95_06690, partial [Thermomicrobiales bacterium]|nr:hypothetical protein [Thermomicrobiales bacterium]
QQTDTRGFSMAAQPKPIKVDPDSELGLMLKRAAASGEPVLVETDDAVYELDVDQARRPHQIDGP